MGRRVLDLFGTQSGPDESSSRLRSHPVRLSAASRGEGARCQTHSLIQIFAATRHRPMYAPSTASLSKMALGGARPEQVPARRLGGRDSAHCADATRQTLGPEPDQGGSENVYFNTSSAMARLSGG